mgnify:FL=1
MTHTHIDALQLRLSNERIRLNNAKSDKERELRKVWVRQIEDEIALERTINKMGDLIDLGLSDDEILALLKD